MAQTKRKEEKTITLTRGLILQDSIISGGENGVWVDNHFSTCLIRSKILKTANESIYHVLKEDY